MPSDVGLAEDLSRVCADDAQPLRYEAARAAGNLHGVSNFRHAVRDLVVVASSSRGGSSLLAELLRRSTSLLSLRGELSPFLALRGLSFPRSGAGSDALSEDDVDDAALTAALEEDLAGDCGSPTDVLDTDEDIWTYASALTCRLTLQWPTVPFEIEHVHACVRDTLSALQRTMGWPRGRFQDAGGFHAAFLSRLVKRYPAVNPFYYDIDRGLLEVAGVTARPRLGPPSPYLVEEPPFIAITPWKLASAEALASRPLVIKTPSNVYRLDYLRKFFPNAKLRVVHLTRNAAASINGLYEGWRYGGFFSHALPERLDIRGYSDQFPEWGTCWWKFDLPPGWRDHIAEPLERVCMWQWQSAHRAIMSYLEQHRMGPDHVKVVHFEDVVSTETRAETLGGLMEWLTGKRQDFHSESRSRLPVVMATYPPQPARWRKRGDMIGPLLEQREVREMMSRLGYDGHPSVWG
jgi:hypothetical protein